VVKIATFAKPQNVIGKLLSNFNCVELFVNNIIEAIVLTKTLTGDGNMLLHYSINEIEKLSVKARISFAVVLINITFPKPDEIEDIAKRLKDFADYYNKNIRDFRDFIAHNPLTIKNDTKEGRVISSRMSQDKFNSLTIEALQEKADVIQIKIEELLRLTVHICHHYSYKPTRELSTR
jgi:hypothetical protein